MAKLLFSLPPEVTAARTPPPQGAAADFQGAPRARGGPVGAGPAPLTAHWRRADGSKIGRGFRVPPSASTMLEFPHADGRIASGEVATPAVLSREPPPEADMLALSSRAREVATLPLSGLFSAPQKLPKPQIDLVGDPHARFVVPVFAERFTDHADFLARVGQLHGWILTQPPFDQPAVGSRLAFRAHFWPSDPQVGLFNTPDSGIIDGRLFFGDRELARRLLKPWAEKAKVSLVLINSSLRGGAGGQAGYSAWTSITAAPGEHWESVCLHEIGHGLGLADEYLDAAREKEWCERLEPNVSRDAAPAAWPKLVKAARERAPGFDAQTGAPASFQGARYRTDHFRSAGNCLMRETGQPFCTVCQAHIISTL